MRRCLEVMACLNLNGCPNEYKQCTADRLIYLPICTWQITCFLAFLACALRAARANGGQLSVTQVLERDAGGPRGLRTSGSTYDTVEHQIGSLQGTALLNPRFDPMRDLREISEVFEPHVQADADAAFYYFAGMGEAQRNRLAAGLQAATRRGASVAATLVECRQFFSEANIRLLATWGQHPYRLPPPPE